MEGKVKGSPKVKGSVEVKGSDSTGLVPGSPLIMVPPPLAAEPEPKEPDADIIGYKQHLMMDIDS